MKSQSLYGGVVPILPCSKQINLYLAAHALDLLGSCTLDVCVPQTNVKRSAEVCIVPGQAATLLRRELSE